MRTSTDHFGHKGSSQTHLALNKRQIGNPGRGMQNAMQGSRNGNPLHGINGQQPQTFNQLAVGPKGMMGLNSNTFDNNSVDRMI